MALIDTLLNWTNRTNSDRIYGLPAAISVVKDLSNTSPFVYWANYGKRVHDYVSYGTTVFQRVDDDEIAGYAIMYFSDRTSLVVEDGRATGERLQGDGDPTNFTLRRNLTGSIELKRWGATFELEDLDLGAGPGGGDFMRAFYREPGRGTAAVTISFDRASVDR